MSSGSSDASSLGEPLVLVFDGHCGVCSRFVAWTKARDKAGRIRFVVCQKESERPAGVERADCEKEAVAVGPGPTTYRGADAIDAVLRELPRPWPAIARLSDVGILDAIERVGYRWFARHRHFFSRWGIEPECGKPGVNCG